MGFSVATTSGGAGRNALRSQACEKHFRRARLHHLDRDSVARERPGQLVGVPSPPRGARPQQVQTPRVGEGASPAVLILDDPAPERDLPDEGGLVPRESDRRAPGSAGPAQGCAPHRCRTHSPRPEPRAPRWAGRGRSPQSGHDWHTPPRAAAPGASGSGRPGCAERERPPPPRPPRLASRARAPRSRVPGSSGRGRGRGRPGRRRGRWLSRGRRGHRLLERLDNPCPDRSQSPPARSLGRPLGRPRRPYKTPAGPGRRPTLDPGTHPLGPRPSRQHTRPRLTSSLARAARKRSFPDRHLELVRLVRVAVEGFAHLGPTRATKPTAGRAPGTGDTITQSWMRMPRSLRTVRGGCGVRS